MELLDRTLLRVALVLAFVMYAAVNAGITVVASSSKTSIRAAVQHTPVVVGLRLELHRGCMTLAILAQMRQERYGYTLGQAPAERGASLTESAPYAYICRLGGMASREHTD